MYKLTEVRSPTRPKRVRQPNGRCDSNVHYQSPKASLRLALFHAALRIVVRAPVRLPVVPERAVVVPPFLCGGSEGGGQLQRPLVSPRACHRRRPRPTARSQGPGPWRHHHVPSLGLPYLGPADFAAIGGTGGCE